MSDVVDLLSTPEASARVRATQFVCHVEGAAAFLKAAHTDDRVRIEPPKSATRHVHQGWYSTVLEATATQLHQIMIVFGKFPAHGPGAEAEFEAFRMLSALTTAGPQLLTLVHRDRARAVRELAKHLELVRREFEATAALEETLASEARSAGSLPADSNDPAFGRVRDTLLERAGGTLSLTEAADLLGVSRQALHKRISAGTAIGMMVDGEIAVPKLQIGETGERRSIRPGIGAITKLFKQAEAGPWVALQFLVDPDPNLGKPPIDVLREGNDGAVVQAARAYLHADEE
jgi:hypothetical protein